MKTKILWNHLAYVDQVRAIDLIAELIATQTEHIMKTALEAAVHELKMWSNAPCEEAIEDMENEELMIDLQNPKDKKWIH